ncbi:S-adenosylmethionine decarboxylase proenzyme 4-like [Aristolochia californica]|uniref:S-adenosylmethionine decarboxylase proenzyme 4-like n=1 Tax=Aristolochia californica TaxID=171875 RepID=UPI0035D93C8F
MAVSGFEGFEKRLELHFSGDDPMGLRRLDFVELKQVLDAVQCSVVSAIGNAHFDAYVLSESSLFVYPKKIIIKTCGTTQLLKSVPCLLSHAFELGLTVNKCRYSRGSFIFPKAQPFPHTSFREEVIYLEESLPSHLCYRKACIMAPTSKPHSHSWHVYSASDGGEETEVEPPSKMFTVEACMTQLDMGLTRGFFRRRGDERSGDAVGSEMTESTGIASINPEAIICDYAFDPCGYSMNGMDGARYSTIHVTPEDGYSYASFECVGSVDNRKELEQMLQKVVGVFRPGTISVAIFTEGVLDAAEGMGASVASALKPLGLDTWSSNNSSNSRVEDFPAGGSVTFQTFTDRRK